MCSSLELCLEMFRSAKWVEVARLVDVLYPPMKVNPFRVFFVHTNGATVHVYTRAAIFEFVHTRLISIQTPGDH